MKIKKVCVLLSAFSLALMGCNGENDNNDNLESKSNNIESSVAANSSEVAQSSSAAKSSNIAQSSSSRIASSSNTTSSSSQGEIINTDSETTIFLAGDSTVKTYNDNQYIGGWGQYLDLYLDDNITVKNCAQGGRSSRSFINEGRLYDIKDDKFTYKFSENGGNSIEDDIKAGDYLFIQFGHNDDDTKIANSLAERMVPLGTPDSNRIYPTTPAAYTNIV